MNLASFTTLLGKLPVKHRDTGQMVPFTLFPNQITAMTAMAEQYERTGKVRAIFLKSRRVTVSSLCDALLFGDCLAATNRENLICAHVKDTSEGLFRVPRDLASGVNQKANVCRVMAKRIEVLHREGKSILDIATAGTVSSGRGLTLSGLHLSEAAQYPGQDSFLSLLPAVSKGRDTNVFVESTAFGKTGPGKVFYEFWQAAMARKNEYITIFLGWLTDPACVADEQLAADAPATDLEKELVRDFKATKAQIAWMRNVLESECQGYEKVFLQEYPHTPSVAFIATGDPAFTTEEINYAESTCRPPLHTGHMEWKGGKPTFVKVPGGSLNIWEVPKDGHKYYIGMDAAVGLEAGDFAAVSVWDGSTGHQVAQYADRVVPEVLAHFLNLLGLWYNKALVNGELTGNSGREVLRVFRDKYHYANLATWRGKDDKIIGFAATRRPTLWWEMTTYSRRKLFDCFRMAVRGAMKNEDFCATVRDKALWLQMADATLSDWGRWEIQRGHDDILVSSMLAVVTYAQNPVPKMSGQSRILTLEQDDESRLKGALPGVIDDATLALSRHYRKAMKLSEIKGAQIANQWKRKLGADRLAGL